MYFDLNVIEGCSGESNKQLAILGSDNGLAPVLRQAIIWAKDGIVYWRILGLNELLTSKGSMSSFVISTVPADGPALLGARASADTVMTKFGTRIGTQT